MFKFYKIPSNITVELGKLAFKTNVYPLYEIEEGIIKITKKPAEKTPAERYLMLQGRFKHLNKQEIKEIQEHVDSQWNKLLKLEETGVKIS